MLEIGQVLWLKCRFNNNGDIAKSKHPYLIVAVTDDYVEALQRDTIKGKERKAILRSNKVIDIENPQETVFDESGFVQLDNKFTFENYNGLSNYMRTTDKLSEKKLKEVISEYFEYQEKYGVEEYKIVHMTKDEIEELNN